MQLLDETVCPIHCRIWQVGGRFWIENFGSVNETRINDQPIRRAVLHDGDEVALGRSRFLFHTVTGPAAGERKAS